MLKNYIKIAWRVLKKNRLYTGLNIFGLTLGISGFLMIMLFIQDELRYDSYLSDSDSIYRVSTHWGNFNSASYATAPPALGPRMESDIPEVEAVTRILKWNDFTIQPGSGVNKEQVFREEKVYYAEPNFFKVFDMPILAGSKEKALSEPNFIVITESLSRKYFGDISPQEVLGKVLLIGSNDPTPREIAAVIKDIPAQSHMHFDMLVYEPGMYQEIFLMDSWSWPILYTYAKIAEGNQQAVSSKLAQIVENYAMPSLNSEDGSTDYNLQLMPIQDIHLNSHLLREFEANSYESYVYIFSLVAIFVLLLACINFMNLATAKAGLRSMEVGVRKVMGSKKSQLVYQFLTEAFIIVLISIFLSLLVVQLSNSLFNQISGKDLQFNLIGNPMVLVAIPSLLIVLTLLSGFYPAFYLSSFKPLLIMKKQLSVGKNSHAFRNALVVFQFATSLTLIICTLMVQRQMNFIQNTNPGFDKDQLLIIHNDGEIQNHQREDFKGRFASSSHIQSLSFSTGIPMSGQFQMRSFNVQDAVEEQGMNWYEADADYIDTYQINLLAGRNFARTARADSGKVVINQQAAKFFGILDDPVGQILTKNRGEDDEATLEVIGMVEDFNFESFRNEIKPLVIEYMDNYFLRDYITVRVQAGSMESGLAALEEAWKAYEPRVPMNYSFLDQDFARVYQSEMKMADLLKVLTLLSIIIACLGLFGLTAYTTHLRTKEIGIRKVFGASMMEIFMMLSASYLKLICISILFAIPLAIYFMDQWLEEFAYKTGLNIWVMILATISCLALALATIFFQSYKSIQADPVKSLKDE
ncbi:putative ABC transport system permease protein [Algoriphagus iocasae]|uniref:Putative ABC transport system permease protein n=1 Tax=Algoriphagus iocasae TaxID=1836499 RepID=A0A841MS84_9BACT|nr:ABC transporter permease [Algoriphagus iocasae]MBB6327524.1 putative ABC transport system permease protein [Algoriphagus iocasae]